MNLSTLIIIRRSLDDTFDSQPNDPGVETEASASLNETVTLESQMESVAVTSSTTSQNQSSDEPYFQTQHHHHPSLKNIPREGVILAPLKGFGLTRLCTISPS